MQNHTLVWESGSRLGTTQAPASCPQDTSQAQTKARAHSYTLALHTIATVPSSGIDQELADLPEAKLEYTLTARMTLHFNSYM